MSVLIRLCLIESFNIKVGKGYVLMRNLKDLVGTEDFLHRLELTFHQFLHLINFASIFCRHIVDYSLSTLYIFVIQFLNLYIYHPLFSFYFRNTVWFFIQRSVCVCVWSRKIYFKVQVRRFIFFLNNSLEIFIIKMVIVCRFNK